MGNCSCGSFDSSQVAESTAKLVVHDGRFQEFSYPVKVSYLLQAYQGCFICNSDDMDFDDVVKAVHENELLQPGQLYFALPLDQLNRPLKAEEMAALAVKASSALAKGGGERLGSRRKQIVLFSGEENGRGCRRVAPEVGGVEASIDGLKRRRNRSSGGGGKGKFAAKLGSIPE